MALMQIKEKAIMESLRYSFTEDELIELIDWMDGAGIVQVWDGPDIRQQIRNWLTAFGSPIEDVSNDRVHPKASG